MNPTSQQIRHELELLAERGQRLLETEQQRGPISARAETATVSEYQGWYTAALPVVRQLLPDRYEEFVACYHNETRRSATADRYTISDYFRGVRLSTSLGFAYAREFDIFVISLANQVNMLRSALARLDALLSNIRGVLQAQLFDDELAAASHLRDNGHLRAAGAVAGVVLEGHLKEVATKHAVRITKKDPSIGDWNDALKADGVLDVPDWRFIQRLADLRNLCDHKKAQEPTQQDVDDLIRGTDKIVKTVF